MQFIVASYRYVAITSSCKAALVLAQSILNTRLLDQCLLMEDSLSDTFKFRYYSKKNSILFHRYWSCIDTRMPESILLQYWRKSIKYSFEYSIDTSEPIPRTVSISFRRFLLTSVSIIFSILTIPTGNERIQGNQPVISVSRYQWLNRILFK